MNPAAQFPLEELTTPEVWEQLHVQVFRVRDGVRQLDSFLIQNENVTPLGVGFGGYGIMSMCVTDLDADGQPELAFTYSWGSGIHRSHLCVWTGGSAWVDAAVALRDYDLSLSKMDGHGVQLDYGTYDPGTNKVSVTGTFGDIIYTKTSGKPELSVRLRQGLPRDVEQCAWASKPTTNPAQPSTRSGK
ncbi:MAG: hypothetical protein ACM359_05990 [Bacillota bacterium]